MIKEDNPTATKAAEREEKLRTLEDTVKEIQDKYGEGAIMKLGEARKVDVDVIPTGSLALDMALGVGGVPRGRVIEIFGPESSGKCIRSDSIVFSEFGMLPISAFGSLQVPGFQKKEILVYSERSFERTNHFYNDGMKNTIRLRTRYDFTIEGTPNHRIRILDRKGNYLFRRLDELRPDDHVAVQRGQNCFGAGIDLSNFRYERRPMNTSPKTFLKPRTLNKDWALLMGYLIGDGTLTSRGLNKNNLQFTAGDREVKTDFSNICGRLFGERPKITPDKRTETTARLVIHNAEARAFLAFAGIGWVSAGEKSIPWTVLCAPKHIVAAFLSALFECDGCFSGGTIEYCTKSTKLAEQLQLVLLNFGIVAKKKERIVNQAPYHYLYIEGQRDKETFLREIGFRSRRKNNLLHADIRKRKMPKTNFDVIPNINWLIEAFFEAFKVAVRKTNRRDWEVIYDYLPKPRGGGHQVSYDRLQKILRWFHQGQNIPEYQRLEELRDLDFFYDRIAAIHKSRNHVVDFTVPKSAAFFANGFVNHNTTLALHIVAEAQKKGGLAAFVDAEHALDPDYGKRLGVKVNDLLISQPDTGEQALEIVESLVRSGSVDVVVIDSVAALTPQAEIEGEMGQQHIGLQARLMSHALRKLTATVSKTKTCIIFLNQIRMQIGIMFGNPETTPGGRALKFYSSVRIDLRRAAQIKKGEEIVGNRVNVKVVKNKVAAPFRRAEFDIFYNEGISKDAELLTLGEKHGVVKKSGASFTFEGTRLGQGFDNARMFLKQNPKIAEDIGKKIREAITAPAGE